MARRDVDHAVVVRTQRAAGAPPVLVLNVAPAARACSSRAHIRSLQDATTNELRTTLGRLTYTGSDIKRSKLNLRTSDLPFGVELRDALRAKRRTAVRPRAAGLRAACRVRNEHRVPCRKRRLLNFS
eukprot:COSAG06_NODE_717_length_12831_cov_52.780003_6_plen_127_part_00